VREETILIVEDDPYELERSILLAKKAGFASFGVGNIEAARHLLENKRFDILLTDIFLRKMDEKMEGLQILSEALNLTQESFLLSCRLIQTKKSIKRLYDLVQCLP
jgi:DNA-binding response OmpR family regulator